MTLSPYLRRLRDRIGHELVLLPSVAVMVLDEARRVLLVRALDTGSWQTVGGAVDPDETPADAAVREAWEETGLLVEPTGVIGVYGGPEFRLVYPNGDVCSYCAISFAARVVGGRARADHVETTEVGWFDADALRRLDLATHTRLLVRDALARDPAVHFARPGWRPPVASR